MAQKIIVFSELTKKLPTLFSLVERQGGDERKTFGNVSHEIPESQSPTS